MPPKKGGIMKFLFLLITLLTTWNGILFAKDIKVKYQDIPQEKMHEQNREIADLAAKELSKNLPQKIDKYTTLKSIVNKETTLVYTFVLNVENRSDEAIQKDDHSRMQKAVTQGVCQSSKRFLEAGINISYIYLSAKTSKELFRFDITKEKCHYSRRTGM